MPSLPLRRLGKDGPLVSTPGFGAMTIGMYGQPLEERLAILDRAHELGCRFWDTADIYGDSEELIGKWFKRTGKRADVFLATKFGIILKSDGLGARNDAEYIRQCVDSSLAKLGIEKIDLYYCHRLDGSTPIETVVKTMAELQAEGKIKHIGLSEVSSTSLRRASKVAKITAVQTEYSPFSLDVEQPSTNLLSTCRELGVSLVAYSPLGRGLITGQYRRRDDLPEDDYRRHFPRFSEENFGTNLKLVEVFEQMAEKKDCKAGQVALAWLMKQGEDIVPIPGTRKLKYLEENIKAAGVHLTSEEVMDIRIAVDNAGVAGPRYGAGADAGLFADSPLPC